MVRFDSVLQTLPSMVLSIIFFFFFAMIKPALSQNLPAITKPGCAATCGGVSIPYPFGTTENCYRSPSFMVVCNETFSPPQLFLGESTMQIQNISLDEGQLTVMKLIGHVCYHPNGSRASITETSTTLLTHLTISNTANKVTVVGCDAYGIVSGQRLGRSYLTGCMTTCYTREDLMEGSCTGSGCCQTSLPQNVWDMDIDLGSFSNYKNVSDFNDCGYAFVAEQNAFNFSYQSLIDLKNVTRLPMVIDWAMENLTCADAAKMGTGNVTYACLSSNSTCVEPIHGNGYRCSCLEGYQGNPYLVDGCTSMCIYARVSCFFFFSDSFIVCVPIYDYRAFYQFADIDECKDPDLKKACGDYECVNNEGSFECRCPKGYRGDGKKTGVEGCRRGESLILRIVAGFFNICLIFLVHDVCSNKIC
ncbi:PREDICTED: wall-associated receptor kinase 2-like [Erythranthe guttata]|uniref:wall-associated receptor kinase 2-like n=1 Tax=Erythranthe guttata TaxID=4155 RepID=UPI00064D83BF|nr:PREDICTED: wall-associated receptor kinase 2-like [Erythranthe guttata]|eukprot:XP_012854705.1 PREDICTED: wall-associated receptor kinase 2-like [Erythranthe guttata]